MIDVFRMFFRGWQPLIILLCLLLATLFESIGLASVLPLITVTLGEGRDKVSPLEQAVFDALNWAGLPIDFGFLLLLIIGGLTAKQLFEIWAGNYIGGIVAGIATDFRIALMDGLLRARWSYFAGRPRGHFLNALGAEIQSAATAYEAAAKVLAQAVAAIAYLGLALAVSWRLFLIALLIGTISSVILNRLVYRARRLGRKQRRLSRQLAGHLTDLFTGLKPLKAMSRHFDLARLLARQTHRINRIFRQQIINRTIVSQLRDPIEAGLLAVAFYVAVRPVRFGGAAIAVGRRPPWQDGQGTGQVAAIPANRLGRQPVLLGNSERNR